MANCTNERGGTFARNQSSTWSTQKLSNGGLFELNTIEESLVGLNGNAYYGFDTIALGAGLPAVANQMIAGLATNDFFFGSLGLSALAFNITDMTVSIPSLLSTLKNSSLISSRRDQSLSLHQVLR